MVIGSGFTLARSSLRISGRSRTVVGTLAIRPLSAVSTLITRRIIPFTTLLSLGRFAANCASPPGKTPLVPALRWCRSGRRILGGGSAFGPRQVIGQVALAVQAASAVFSRIGAATDFTRQLPA